MKFTLNRIFSGVAMLWLFGHSAQSQVINQWTWMKGSNSAQQYGVYGTLGTAASSNLPGARRQPGTWTDSSGDLWMFGGDGRAASTAGSLNDLWKYNPASNQWTWVKGSSVSNQNGSYGTQGTANSSNVPGARFAPATWIDSTGVLWLFGGYGYPATGSAAGYLNDLWKYNPTNNQWTWVKGSNDYYQNGTYGTQGTAASTNTPGSRYGAASCVDQNGNLWLFGGAGSGYFNDLWKYDPATNMWTWMKGSSSTNVNGSYGTMGVSATSNTPGGRRYPSFWIGDANTIWLHGGYGYSSSTNGEMNDLWVYSISTNQWTWVKGSNGVAQYGTYGTLGVSASSNLPGSRAGATRSLVDNNGDFWVFGGGGFANSTSGYLNDLWKYQPSINQWTWYGGNNSANQFATYGTQGTPSASNKPSGRQEHGSWIDNTGTIWIFGGEAYNGSASAHSDLWRYKPGVCVIGANIASITNVSCLGQNTGSITAAGTNTSGSTTYLWSGGGTAATKSALVAGTYTVTVTDATGCTATASGVITQPASAVSVSIGGVSNVLCNGNSTGQATASGSGGTGTITYAWSGGGTAATKTGMSAGAYTVTATDANGCTSTASVTITQPSALSVGITSSTHVACLGGSTGQATASGSGGTTSYSFAWSGGGTSATKTGMTAGTYTVTITDANGCTATTSVTITQPSSAVSVGVGNITNVLCFGQSTGSATASGTGGTGSISYAWSGGGTNATKTGMSAGTYTVTATDANGCTATNSVSITQPSSAVSVSVANVTNALCFGETTGSASATGTGGTGAISYAWSSGSTSNAMNSVSAGVYTVTATDANGCTSTSSVVISQPVSALAVTISGTTPIPCHGQNTGTATAVATGGTGTSSYAWSTGSTSATANGLSADTYTVTATDQNNCSATTTIAITEPDSLSANVGATDEVCLGQNNGSALATAEGGTPPYLFMWSNGETTSDADSLAPASYFVTITDSNGCSITDSILIAAGNPPPVPDLGPDTLFTSSTVYTLAPGVFDSYLWKDNSTLQFLLVNATDTVWVVVSDSVGCTGSDTVVVTIWPTGISEHTSPFITVYPNPSDGRVTIKSLNLIQAGTAIVLMNAQGQTVLSETVQHESNNYQLNVEHLSKGTYIMRMQQEDTTLTVNVVVM